MKKIVSIGLLLFCLVSYSQSIHIQLQSGLLASDPVTLGTPNGLSLTDQILSLDLATVSTSGAISAIDKSKIDDTPLENRTEFLNTDVRFFGELGVPGSTGNGVKEEGTIDTTGIVAADIDGDFINIPEGPDASANGVAFWFDIDDSGTTIPAGASAIVTAGGRAVEINTINTSDAVGVQATKIATAILADAGFDIGSAVVNVVSYRLLNALDVADGADGSQATGMAFAVTVQGAGWIDTATGISTIDIVNQSVFGTLQDVVRHNDDTSGGSTTSQIALTAQNWSDINAFGTSYGGISRLDTVNGASGFFSGLQDDVPDKRYGVTFSNDGGKLNLNAPGSDPLNVTMDGTSGNPTLNFDEWFRWEVVVPAGLGAADVYINGVLLSEKLLFVTNTGGAGTSVRISSGSTSGTNRISFHANFGSTIYEDSSTKTLLNSDFLGFHAVVISIPPGKRDYIIQLDAGIEGREIGGKIEITAQNINGNISIVDLSATGNILINGLNAFSRSILEVTSLVAINTVDGKNSYFLPLDVVREDTVNQFLFQDNLLNKVVFGSTLLDGSGSQLQVNGGLSVTTGNVNIANLTASQFVKTDGSKNLLSSASVSLTADVSGILPLPNGGTNKALSASAGSIAFSDADSLEFSAVGTTGQALVSGGTGTPTFFAPTLGSVIFAGTSGVLTQDSPSFFWDNVSNRLGIGINTPASALHIKADTPGTVGDAPAGQVIIQALGTSINVNAALTGYNSNGPGNPNIQLWYLGSSSGSNSDITFLNRIAASLTLGTNGLSRLTIDSVGNVIIGNLNLKDNTLSSTSGNIILTPTASLVINDASIGTAGECLVSTDTAGTANWEPCPNALSTATIDGTGTPSITRQKPTWISSITDNGTGNYTLQIVGSFWSLIPSCTCSGSVFGNICNISSSGTTAVSVRHTTSSGTNTDSTFHINCPGTN